jgi:hypothetical protein
MKSVGKKALLCYLDALGWVLDTAGIAGIADLWTIACTID